MLQTKADNLWKLEFFFVCDTEFATFFLDYLSELVWAIGLAAFGSDLRLGIIEILLSVWFMGSTVIGLHADVALVLGSSRPLGFSFLVF